MMYEYLLFLTFSIRLAKQYKLHELDSVRKNKYMLHIVK